MRKITVLVTGIGGGSVGHQIVKALKLAGHYWLVGVDMSAASFGLFDVDEAYTVPAASDPCYIDTLLDICDQRQVSVLIPGSEPELKVISKNRERFLSADVLLLINNSDVIELGMDKSATMAFLQARGFTVPFSLVVQTEADIPHDFPLPAVVKPSVGGGGSTNTFLAQDESELFSACCYLMRQGSVVLVQEYVGTPEDEYTVGVLHTLDGDLVGSIAVHRHIMSGLSGRIKAHNRTGRTELGRFLVISSGISQGVVDDFPEVRQGCEAIAEAIGSKGPVNIQCRFVDGTLYPFEINPRFSGTETVRALVGFNEADILIRYHLLGQTLSDVVSYKFGRVVRGLVERYVTDLPSVQPWSASNNRRFT